jgi:hypothetical protein
MAHLAAGPPVPLDQTIHHGQVERPKPAWRPNSEDNADFSDLPPPEQGEDEEGPGSWRDGQIAGSERAMPRTAQDARKVIAEIRSGEIVGLQSLEAILVATPGPIDQNPPHRLGGRRVALLDGGQDAGDVGHRVPVLSGGFRHHPL